MNAEIKVIVFKDDDNTWVAQGLEHDICVQASSLDDLQVRFEVAVRLESEEAGGLGRIGRAPDHFFDLWEKRAGAFTPSSSANASIEFGLAA
jgi:hypothetical protein